MFAKIVAVIAFVTLPLDLSLWHQSHQEPTRYRWDVTLYKSMTVYLRDGVCAVHVLSMPTKTASKSEFRTPVSYNPVPNQASLLLTSTRKGPYVFTWVVFPFWIPTLLALLAVATPIAQGPIRRWSRRRRGCCLVCGYNLRGNRSGRCPECGDRFRS